MNVAPHGVVRLAIIGGGITALAAARRARELAASRPQSLVVALYERSQRLGGCISTERRDDCILELGPDSLLAEKPAGIELIRALGLADDIVAPQPEFRGSCIVRGRRLIRIPDDVRLFTPTSMLSLARSGLLGVGGLARAALEPLIPRRRAEDDETLAHFVTRRLGRATLERIAAPLVSGVFAGPPERVSVNATMPALVEMERRYGSLVRALRATAPRDGSPPKARLVSLRSGLSSLTQALERELGEVIHAGTGVRSIARSASGGDPAWRLEMDDGSTRSCDRLICTVPAHEAARLLAGIDGAPIASLRAIPYHSVATVTMVFATDTLPRFPICSGFVIPAEEGRSVMAVTLTSQKYPARTPTDRVAVRAFVNDTSMPNVLQADDPTLLAAVRADLADLLALHAAPQFSLIARWPDALPEYALGHLDRVREIERATAALGRLALAGAAYRGPGIPDCIRSGEEAAERVLVDDAKVLARR